MPEQEKPPPGLSGWSGFQAFPTPAEPTAPEPTPEEQQLSSEWSAPEVRRWSGPVVLPQPPMLMQIPKRPRFRIRDYFRYEWLTLRRGISDTATVVRQNVGRTLFGILVLLVVGAKSGMEIWGREVPDFVGAAIVALAGVGLLFLFYFILAAARGHYDQKHALEVKDALLLRHAQGILKPPEDVPVVPPFLIAVRAEYNRHWVPLLKVYDLAVREAPGRAVTLRVLCDRELANCSLLQVTAEPTRGSGIDYLPIAMRGVSSFTFTLDGAAAQAGCFLEVRFQSTLPPCILEIEVL